MLDLKFVREHQDKVEQALKNRGQELSLDEYRGREAKRRQLLTRLEELRHERNTLSKEVGRLDAGPASGMRPSPCRTGSPQSMRKAKTWRPKPRPRTPGCGIFSSICPTSPTSPCPWGRPATTTRWCRPGGRPPGSTFPPRPTGTSGRTWASWISNGPPRSPGPASRCSKGPGPGWSGP